MKPLMRAVALILLCLIAYTCKDDVVQSAYGTLTVAVENEAGKPLDGVTLTLQPTTESPQAKGNGLYEFTNLKPGSYDITASLAGYNDSTISVDIQKSEQTVKIVMTKTLGKIAGVVSSASGTPLDSAYVMLLMPSCLVKPVASNGSYGFDKLEKNKSYRLHAFRVGYKSIMNKSVVAKEKPDEAEGSIVMEKYEGSLRLDKTFIDMGDLDESSGYAVFEVKTSADWQLLATPKWIKVDSSYRQGKGEGVVLFYIDKKELNAIDDNERLGEIKVTSGGSECGVWVAVSGTGKGIEVGQIITQNVRNPTTSSAVISCIILNNSLRNTENIEDVGICLSSTNKSPDILDAIPVAKTAINVDGKYEVSQDGLEAGSTYHTCAYIRTKGSSGYIYGNTVTFTTRSMLPKVSMTEEHITNVTSSAASFRVDILANGEPKYREVGFVYAEHSNPTVASCTEKLLADNKFSAKTIRKLELDKDYWVSAYATSSINGNDTTVYSIPAVRFQAKLTPPALSAPTISNPNIAAGTAVFQGNILKKGDPAYVERGFVYGDMPMPTVEKVGAEGAWKDQGSNGGEAPFSVSVSHIVEGKSYYVRAYATDGENYTEYSAGDGIVLKFIAAPPTLTQPIISNKNIANQSASIEATITLGDLPIVERGFVYGTNNNPDITSAQNIKIPSIGTVAGKYSENVTGLTLDKQYHVRAYATTSKETVYGDAVSFTLETVLPTVSTQAVSNKNISAGTAMFNGKILTIGEPAYTERGFVYGTTHNPTTADTKIIATGTGTGIYSANVSDISEGKTYYIRAYALNAKGTVYGEEVPLNFVAAVPEVSTQAVSDKNIGAGTATFHGTLVSAGDLPITERGFVYGITNNPTISNTKVLVAGSGTGIYSANITNLEEGNIYYVRAFVRNSKTTEYGAQVSVDFNAVMPTLNTQSISNKNIGAGTATFNGTILTVGDPAYTERGFVYATTRNPTTANTKTTATGIGIGLYSANVSDIQEGYTYYIRAYALNAKGTEYGEEVPLNFVAAVPEVSTQAVSDKNIGAGTATFHGTLVSAGDLPITERGFVYGITNNPTISNTKVLVAGSGTGIYSANITNLEEGNIYYVRAFAANIKTTVYGAQKSVDFNAVMPMPDMQKVADIGATSATLHGSITTIGDPAYTEKGFVYGTSINPTIENGTKEAVAGSGSGVFSKTLLGLTEGTPYYVRTYVTYPNGTVYSNNYKSFNTLFTLTGTVKYEQTNVGINGATVLIKQGGTTVGQATTGSSGEFVIANMALGSYTITASAAGYADNTTTVTFSAIQKTASITLSLPGTINGTLKDDDGFAIKNVNVELHQNSIRKQTAVTNANGEYSFSNVTPGDYSIFISVDFHEYFNTPITVVSGDNAKDYTIKITAPFAFDPGTSNASFIPIGSYMEMYYESAPQSIGTTVTRTVRIKNNRQKSLSWSLTDVPPDGITFSPQSGTIAANGVVSITATFTFPNTTGGSTQVSLSGCSINSVSYKKSYLWNWAGKEVGYSYNSYSGQFIKNNCSACSMHAPLITVGEHSDRFDITFNQFIVWK